MKFPETSSLPGSHNGLKLHSLSDGDHSKEQHFGSKTLQRDPHTVIVETLANEAILGVKGVRPVSFVNPFMQAT